ncbi:MAG: hypothetical protein KDB40_23495, partial [Acidimicrobiales bacterium]|nr:hypothetical protein [Acidimicrobiales bacterium]
AIGWVLVAVVVAVLATLGVSGGSGPASTPLGRTDTVVLVSVPGLRWQDLVATDTPAIDALMSSAATMSVRGIGPETSTPEGYLTVGAGNRVEVNGVRESLIDGRCLPVLAASATAAADDDLNGAEPGALGTRLAELGVPTAVYGPLAAIGALMDAEGCVGRYVAADSPTSVDPGVTLVQFDGLGDVERAADRSAALADIDRRIAALTLPESALVVVFAPSATNDLAEVTAVGVRHPLGAGPAGSGAGALVSPTTRRAGYVTLPDLAPAVLSALDGPATEVPAAMSGTEMRVVAGDSSRAEHEAELADLAERVLFRDRAVGPVSVVLVVLLVVCGAAALGRRARLARTLAPIVIAYPTIAFATGLVAYHQLPLEFVVVVVPVAAAALASIVTSALSRVGRWAGVAALAIVLWALLVIDVCTGGRLQINTPLGYTPTVAGRFQGYGNLSFGLVGAAAIVAATVALHTRAGRTTVLQLAALVGGVTTVAVAAPGFGSDVGGTLAIVPAFAVTISMIAGWRVGWRRSLAIGAATVAVLATLAVVDLQRDAASRTHLGRFLDDLLHGDGGLVIRRKLRANMAILTSSFWSFVLIGVLVAVAVVAWRRRETVLPAIRRRQALRVFLAGFATVAVLGYGFNDSGLAVPSIMLAVAIPWVVASTMAPVTRSGR